MLAASACSPPTRLPVAARRARSRQAAVARAEAYLRANVRTSVPVSRLCRVVGLSERGLRNAFYGVHGVSPKQFMQTARLEAVRQALTARANTAATVTGIATTYGFYELGRFAVSYRKAFGEAPSVTLRRLGSPSSGVE